MGPSEKSFNQVKAILGKLDRSIDQLRERRTTPAAESTVGSQVVPTPSRTTMIPPPAPAPGANATPTRPASQYGRATPIPPSKSN